MKPKTLLLLGIALLAAYLGARALKRNAEVVQLLCALIGMTATASLANTPKTRSVENRLNALVPVVFPNTGGKITGNVDVTGNHTVGGQLLVNATGSATMEVGGNAHVTSTLQVDNAVTSGTSVSAGTQILAGGASGSATMEVNGNGHVTSTLQVDGTMSTGANLQVNTSSGSATLEVNGNGHITSGLQVGGALTTSTGGSIPQPRPSNPGSPSSTYNSAWASSVTNIVQDIINQLVAAGVLS